ncbi:MAG: RNA 2',3'-cyclic phosphodiesterase [Acidobacteria bacterium]|nr:RNA 2',3'-cyclic phosphodiesterase [Acidobacteriota bacterium]
MGDLPANPGRSRRREADQRKRRGDPLRLFIAWTVPETLATEIHARIEQIRGALPRASWTKPAQLHLTFAFLGEQDVSVVPRVSEGLDNAARSSGPFDVRLSEVSAFPEPGRPRVLWIGLERNSGLEAIADSVRTALDSANVDYDRKPFRSHLTLGRAKDRWRRADLENLAGALESFRGRSCPVSAISLYESRLGSGGATHVEAARFPLRS